MLFVAGFFSNLSVGVWIRLGSEQQECQNKTPTADQDTSPPLTRRLKRPGMVLFRLQVCPPGDSRWPSHRNPLVYHTAEHVDPLTKCLRQSAASQREAANPDIPIFHAWSEDVFLLVSIQGVSDFYLLESGRATGVSDGWWSAASATDWLIRRGGDYLNPLSPLRPDRTDTSDSNKSSGMAGLRPPAGC